MQGSTRQETSLTLVGPTSAISARFAENCIFLYTKYPFLRLHLKSEDHINLVEMVRRGEADLAVVPPTSVPNEMESKTLKPERYTLVASSKWHGRNLRDILEGERIVDFYDSDRTTLNYLQTFKLDKYNLRSRIFVNENDALIRYFIEGVGFGTLTEAVAKPHLERGDIIRLNKGQTMEEPLALIWFARSKRIPYFEELVRSVK